MSRNKDVSLQKRYRYFVSDYDLKQHVKTCFKRPAVLVFLEHTQNFFLGRIQLRNQGEGAKRASPSFSHAFGKLSPKHKRLNVFWT